MPSQSLARELRERRRADRFVEYGEGLRVTRDGRDVTEEIRAQALLPAPTHPAPTAIQ